MPNSLIVLLTAAIESFYGSYPGVRFYLSDLLMCLDAKKQKSSPEIVYQAQEVYHKLA